MDQTSDLSLEKPASAKPDRRRGAGGRTVLWLHRQADRMDLVPPEFGREAEVDPGDGGSLLKEWLRQARLWADYNPEQLLALKAGAVALGIALLVLVILVGAIR